MAIVEFQGQLHHQKSCFEGNVCRRFCPLLAFKSLASLYQSEDNGLSKTDETNRVRTVCPYCGVGCGMFLHVSGGRVVKSQGDPEHPANYGKLCTKGATCAQTLNTSDRLSQALLRTVRTELDAGRETPGDPLQPPATVAASSMG